MKFWASVCSSRGDSVSASLEASLAFPLHNRDIIEDPKGLKLSFLELLQKNSSLESIESMGLVRNVPNDMQRRTFVLSRDHIEKLKKWVTIKGKNNGVGTLHVSTFVVTCSLIWVCKTKSEDTKVSTLLQNNDEYILAFMADYRSRPEFSIPSNYFGNCLGCGNVVVKRSKLVGENGIFDAAVAIGKEIRDLQCEPFKGVEILMSNFTEFANLGQHMVIIAGSQKLDVYETEFGWGKPKMSEVVHVDNSGSISLSDCRDKEGGIEVGLALGRIQMMKFNSILEEHLTEVALS